jgi:hypothetical protein
MRRRPVALPTLVEDQGAPAGTAKNHRRAQAGGAAADDDALPLVRHYEPIACW